MHTFRRQAIARQSQQQHQISAALADGGVSFVGGLICGIKDPVTMHHVQRDVNLARGRCVTGAALAAFSSLFRAAPRTLFRLQISGHPGPREAPDLSS
jgi:hypothetical protein